MDSQFLNFLGTFLIRPGVATKTYIEASWPRARLTAHLWVQFIGIFTGLTLMFFLFYPEVYWVPGSLTSGPNLFILQAAQPLHLLAAFSLGYALVVFVGHWGFSAMTLAVLRTWVKRDAGRVMPQQVSPRPLNLKDYAAVAGFCYTPLALANVIVVFWLYFNEKFLFSKIFFPVTDLTGPLVVLLCTLGTFLGLKFYLEFHVNKIYFSVSSRTAILPILVQLAILAAFAGVVVALTNAIAGQFA